jgi:dienelactone hydrolase
MFSRRKFIRNSGLAGITWAALPFDQVFSANGVGYTKNSESNAPHKANMNDVNMSIIGAYGPWAATLHNNKLPRQSFRNDAFKDIEGWRKKTKQLLLERMSVPDIGSTPSVEVKKQYTYDGLHVEELSWRLPYGRPTKAILLKPANARGRLPAVLAFHCHGGNKYFGTEKITRTPDEQHPMMKEHQEFYYGGRAWANELAKRGFVVLVPDAFTFASRRVMLQDVPESLRNGLNDTEPDNQKNIDAYNDWAANHEHVMAKSLFCAGTTWPAVFFAEDKVALDILCARPDVDAEKVGCGGLSGGGIRTDFMAGLDPRIKCSVTVGFMTTWKDLILNKSYTHTWMTYVPQLPNELDFPEILGLRAPLPTLVLNDKEDFLFTMPEMQEADRMLGEVFEKAGAREKYKCSFYPGPHKFDRDMQEEAFAWWEKWLA